MVTVTTNQSHIMASTFCEVPESGKCDFTIGLWSRAFRKENTFVDCTITSQVSPLPCQSSEGKTIVNTLQIPLVYPFHCFILFKAHN